MFCDQKIIRKAYAKKFLLLVYLPEGYESIRNKIDHLCLLQNFIESFSKLLYELRVCFNIIPSNYRPNNDMFISPVNVNE